MRRRKKNEQREGTETNSPAFVGVYAKFGRKKRRDWTDEMWIYLLYLSPTFISLLFMQTDRRRTYFSLTYAVLFSPPQIFVQQQQQQQQQQQ